MDSRAGRSAENDSDGARRVTRNVTFPPAMARVGLHLSRTSILILRRIDPPAPVTMWRSVLWSRSRRGSRDRDGVLGLHPIGPVAIQRHTNQPPSTQIIRTSNHRGDSRSNAILQKTPGHCCPLPARVTNPGQIHYLGLFTDRIDNMWMSRTADHETSLQAGDKTPHDETALSQHSVPSIEDVLRRFLAIETGSADMPAEPRWDSDSELQETEAHPLCDRQSENILHEARRILRRTVTIKADRVRTGRSPIPDN